MSHRVFAAAVVGIGLLVGVVVAQQGGSSNPSVVGVWRVSEVTFTGPNARKIASPQPSVRIYTQRHYSITQVTSDKPRAEIPPEQEATEKQLADAFGPFAANAGTYDIKGNELTHRLIVAKVPQAMRTGSFNTFTFKFEGRDTLWLTPKSNQNGPVANPTTVKLTRVD